MGDPFPSTPQTLFPFPPDSKVPLSPSLVRARVLGSWLLGPLLRNVEEGGPPLLRELRSLEDLGSPCGKGLARLQAPLCQLIFDIHALF